MTKEELIQENLALVEEIKEWDEENLALYDEVERLRNIIQMMAMWQMSTMMFK